MQGDFITGVRRARLGLVCAGLAVSLGGCGMGVPNIQEDGFDDKNGGIELEEAIVRSIHCELRGAIAAVLVNDASQGTQAKPASDLLQGWSVQVALTLTLDEKMTLNPNLTATFLPSMFTIGPSISATTHATRVDKLNYYYTIQELQKKGRCDGDIWSTAKNWNPKGDVGPKDSSTADAAETDTRKGSFLIRSDLKTKEWLMAQVLNKFADGFVPSKNGLQHEVTFVLDTTIGLTPSVKWTTITLMPTGTFFSGERTRTHDLTLTFGPATDDDKAKQQLAPAAQAMFLSSQISSGLKTGSVTISP